MADHYLLRGGNGTYRATRGDHRWTFFVIDGRVYYDMTDIGAVEDFPPAVRQDWAEADYEFVR